jgi:ubiquinone biosynthesis protein UbiJ
VHHVLQHVSHRSRSSLAARITEETPSAPRRATRVGWRIDGRSQIEHYVVAWL